jgi:CHAT domain-containing protein/Flp pilus assembly protein TadD
MHLTPQEVESLLFGATDSTTMFAGGAAAQEAQQAQQHLSGCAVCQSVAKKYTNADSVLRGLILGNKGLRNDLSGNELSVNKETSNRPKRGNECPAEQTWPNLAAGLLNEDEAAAYVTHAAQCDWCGPLLKESMEDLAQDATAEEQEALDKLPSASRGWQRSMGKKMAAVSGNADDETLVKADQPASSKEPKSKHKAGFGWWPKLVWAGSGFAVITVAVLVGLRLTGEPDVNALLAQAYTEQRTIELRMPGAAYGPMRVERGSSGRSSFSKPTALMAAKPAIKRRLDSEPDNPQWLQAEGWAELLEGEYSPAIQSFKRALDKNPTSAELMRDAAAAYFERGESEGRDSDYRNAAELLNKSLAANPNDPVALFNRAVVYEHLSFYKNAIDDWRHYLQVDSVTDWAADARRRLEEIQKKLKEHEQSSREPLLPEQAFSQSVGGDKSQMWASVDRRIEKYLQEAVTKWLPKAFPASPSAANLNENEAAVHALKVLAQILTRQHGDRWLDDFLTVSNSPPMALAIHELSKAVERNLAGDPVRAQEEARRAEAHFRSAGNQPGIARAQLEQVHALQRAQKGNLCLAASKKLSAQMASHGFKWITVQLLMEQASCQGKLNDFPQSVALAEQALASAQQSRFVELQLRALAIAADIELSRGRPERAWKYDHQGVDLYWQCPCVPLRGYSFYDNLEYIAEDSGQWNLARAAGVEAVNAIAATPNTSGEAMARFRLASTNRMLGRDGEAAEDYARAQALFGAEPAAGANHDYMLFSQLFLAELQVRKGETDSALSLLLELEPQLRKASNYLIPLHLYSSLATVYLKKAQYQKSQAAAAKAIRIAEDGLRSIHGYSERLVWRSETNSVYKVFLESFLLDGHDSESSLNFWEWYRAASLRESTARASVEKTRWAFNVDDPKADLGETSLRNVQNRLRQSGQGFVAYAQVPDGLFIWSIGENGVESHWVPMATGELAAHVQRLVSYCSDPNSDIRKLKEEGRYLYGVLIAPVENAVQDKSVLVFELDGATSRLPVEVLVDPSGHYLGESHAISISLGMAFLKDHDEALSLKDKILVVNPPSTAGNELDLSPLPDAVREAGEVAAEFAHPVTLAGPQATVAAVRRALQDATVFHFAGHAFIFGRHSGLLLAREQSNVSSALPIWDAEQIRKSDLRNVRLVVLSSCTTEEADSRMEDDPDSVVGAFLRAGVSHVVASRWNVDSKPTADFVENFYAELRAGSSASQSRRSAAATIRSRVAYSHPYFWASLANFGRAWI